MPSNLATSQQQRGMPNFMPLVRQARRPIRNRQEGTPSPPTTAFDARSSS
jgi:hypothetical protein